MKKQVVKMFIYHKYNPSASQHIEAEAYIVDTSDPNDLDELFKEVYQKANVEFNKKRDYYREHYIHSDFDDPELRAYLEAWHVVYDDMHIVTTADWRHPTGYLTPAQVGPSKDRNGNYLPLTPPEKTEFFYEALISHGFGHYNQDHCKQFVDDAIPKYLDWLDKHTLNYNNLSELNDQIIV